MRKGIFAFIIFSTLLVSACGFINLGSTRVRGSGDVISEERQVGDFTEIVLECSGDVLLTQGEDEALTVEGEDNILPYVTTEVKSGTLYIDIKPNYNVIIRRTLKFYITVEDLESFKISGSGNLDAEVLEAEDLKIIVSGSGDVNIDDLTVDKLWVEIGGAGTVSIPELNAESVETEIDGSGDIDFSGSVESQDLLLSGSGEYRAADLNSRTCDVNVSGSGTAQLRVSDELDITISGSGDVRYYGNPRVDQSITGSGNIISLGD